MKIKQFITLGYIRTKFKLMAMVSPAKTADAAFELFCTPFARSKSKPLAIFTSAQNLSIHLNGQHLRGYCWNKGGSKRILILHGFSSAAHKFHQYVKPLTEKGYEVLAFDAPAHGRSEGKTVNALQYGEMITAINTQFGEVNGYIAHSFGGIALSLVLEKMPHSPATKMVLIAPATEMTTAIHHAFTLLHINNQAVRKAFDEKVKKIGGAYPEWFSIKRAIRQLHCQTLWVHDADDKITPLADAAPVAEYQLPLLQFVTTKGLGHRNIYHSSAVKKQVFDFLQWD
jgi:pimeloyl-ACP methyl ester carboxylesterase